MKYFHFQRERDRQRERKEGRKEGRKEKEEGSKGGREGGRIKEFIKSLFFLSRPGADVPLSNYESLIKRSLHVPPVALFQFAKSFNTSSPFLPPSPWRTSWIGGGKKQTLPIPLRQPTESRKLWYPPYPCLLSWHHNWNDPSLCLTTVPFQLLSYLINGCSLQRCLLSLVLRNSLVIVNWKLLFKKTLQPILNNTLKL